jgi:hypothetical protein
VIRATHRIVSMMYSAPAMAHKRSNCRVSAFFYRYRRDVLDMDETKARAEMEAIWHPEGVWAAFVDR